MADGELENSNSHTYLSFAERYQSDLEIIYQKYEHNFDNCTVESEGILLSTICDEGSIEPWLKGFLESQHGITTEEEDVEEDDDEGWESDSSGPSILQDATASELSDNEVVPHPSSVLSGSQAVALSKKKCNYNTIRSEKGDQDLKSPERPWTGQGNNVTEENNHLFLLQSTKKAPEEIPVRPPVGTPGSAKDDYKVSSTGCSRKALTSPAPLSSFLSGIRNSNVLTSTQIELSPTSRPDGVFKFGDQDEQHKISSLPDMQKEDAAVADSDTRNEKTCEVVPIRQATNSAPNLAQAILNSRNRIASVLFKAVSKKGNSSQSVIQRSSAFDSMSSKGSFSTSTSFLPDKLLKGFNSLLTAEMKPPTNIPRHLRLPNNTAQEISRGSEVKSSKRLVITGVNTNSSHGKVTLVASRKTVKLNPQKSRACLKEIEEGPSEIQRRKSTEPAEHKVKIVGKAVCVFGNTAAADSMRHAKKSFESLSREATLKMSRPLRSQETVKLLNIDIADTPRQSARRVSSSGNSIAITKREGPQVIDFTQDSGISVPHSDIAEVCTPGRNCLAVTEQELHRHTIRKREMFHEGESKSRKRRLSDVRILSPKVKKPCTENLMESRLLSTEEGRYSERETTSKRRKSCGSQTSGKAHQESRTSPQDGRLSDQKPHPSPHGSRSFGRTACDTTYQKSGLKEQHCRSGNQKSVEDKKTKTLQCPGDYRVMSSKKTPNAQVKNNGDCEGRTKRKRIVSSNEIKNDAQDSREQIEDMHVFSAEKMTYGRSTGRNVDGGASRENKHAEIRDTGGCDYKIKDCRVTGRKNKTADGRHIGREKRIDDGGSLGGASELSDDRGTGREDRIADGGGTGREDRIADGGGTGREDRIADGGGTGREDRIADGGGTGREDRIADGGGTGRERRFGIDTKRSSGQFRASKDRSREDTEGAFSDTRTPFRNPKMAGRRKISSPWELPCKVESSSRDSRLMLFPDKGQTKCERLDVESRNLDRLSKQSRLLTQTDSSEEDEGTSHRTKQRQRWVESGRSPNAQASGPRRVSTNRRMSIDGLGTGANRVIKDRETNRKVQSSFSVKCYKEPTERYDEYDISGEDILSVESLTKSSDKRRRVSGIQDSRHRTRHSSRPTGRVMRSKNSQGSEGTDRESSSAYESWDESGACEGPGRCTKHVCIDCGSFYLNRR